MAVNEKLRDHLHDQLFAAVLELQSIDECYEFFEDICTIQEMRAIAVSSAVWMCQLLRQAGSKVTL